MNILVNSDLILLHFPAGRNPADSWIRLLGGLKNIASALVYGGFESFLFHLLQNPYLIDELNDVRQESLQDHPRLTRGMTLQVSDQKQTIRV